MTKSKVYFTKTISPESVVALYGKLGIELPGRVAAKVHSGEKGNQNFLHPDFWHPIIKKLNATVVENNTAYAGQRNSTKKHQKTLEAHGWNVFPFDLLDAEGPDLELEIKNGKILKSNFVGKNLKNYDSMLVLSHFKGHPMGGFGGALKQLSIGCASSAGKAWIHSAGKTKDQFLLWISHVAPQDDFLESMADAASSVVEMFSGKIAYINVMANLSVDCDCCAKAEDPCMNDIGILASLDPIAIDQACLDLIKGSNDPGKAHFLERVESRNGEHILEAAAALGFGSREYELEEL